MKTSTFFGLIVLFLVSCSGGGDKISMGSLDVYYTDGATKTEATDVADYLFGIGFGVSGDQEKVQLSRNGDRYTCKFVVSENETNLEGIWRRYGKSLSQKVLNGAPVDVDLCDENFNSIKFLGSE